MANLRPFHRDSRCFRLISRPSWRSGCYDMRTEVRHTAPTLHTSQWSHFSYHRTNKSRIRAVMSTRLFEFYSSNITRNFPFSFNISATGHRPRKLFENGVCGDEWEHLRPRARLNTVLGWFRRRGGLSPPATAVRGITVSPPENCGNSMCKMGHFEAKLHFVLIPNKVQFWPKLLVTNGSLKLRNGKLATAQCLSNGRSNPNAVKHALYTLKVGAKQCSFTPLDKVGSIDPLTSWFCCLCFQSSSAVIINVARGCTHRAEKKIIFGLYIYRGKL